MISQLQNDVIIGPEEFEHLGRCLRIFPTLETARAGRFPTQAVVVTSAARRIIALNKDGEKLKTVVVMGASADPTAHPDFTEISLNIRELLNKHFNKAKLHLISNAPVFSDARARHALCYYDFPTLRFEAGTAKTFSALSGETKDAFNARIAALKHLEGDKIIITANLMRGDLDNSSDKEVKAWVKLLEEIKPLSLQLTSKGNKEQGTKSITKTRMGEIVDLLTEKLGITPEVLDA